MITAPAISLKVTLGIALQPPPGVHVAMGAHGVPVRSPVASTRSVMSVASVLRVKVKVGVPPSLVTVGCSAVKERSGFALSVYSRRFTVPSVSGSSSGSDPAAPAFAPNFASCHAGYPAVTGMVYAICKVGRCDAVACSDE